MTEELENIHDAELVNISIMRAVRSLRLEFLLVTGGKIQVLVDGVTHFRAADVIMQNVVSRLLISSRDALSDNDIADRLRWVTRLSDTSSFASDPQLDLLRAKLLSNELVLIFLEPSWGAELVIVGKSISVTTS